MVVQFLTGILLVLPLTLAFAVDLDFLLHYTAASL